MNFKEKFTKYLTLEASESGLSKTQIEYVTEMANSLFNQEKCNHLQMIDKGKLIMLLKGYATDGKEKPNTSIDYDRIDDLAEDIVKNYPLPVVV